MTERRRPAARAAVSGATGSQLADSPAPASPDRTEHLLHELQVHQAELERQNEELRVARQAHEEMLARYVDLFEFAPVGYLTLTGEGIVTEANRSCAQLLGLAPGTLLDVDFARFVAPGDHDAWYRLLAQVQREGGRRVGDLQLKCGDGALVHVQLHCLSSPQHPASVRIAVASVEERFRLEQGLRDYTARVEHLASHDALTELPNAALMRDRIAQAIAQARRDKTQAAILFVDLDRFKLINDAYGHQVGDALLRAAAARLGGLLRASDSVARVGGDEFLVLLAGLRRRADAYVVAHKLIEAFRQPFHIAEREIFCMASAGASLFPQDGAEVDALISHADIAMYRAKSDGRDTYQFFTPQMSEETRLRARLEQDLRYALERGQLGLAYQPQVALDSGGIVGCEALLRWTHPQLGAIAPSTFIPIAEDTGLILPIGDWVLRTACRQNKSWQEAGLPAIVMSVNLSARQFRQPDLIERLRDVLVESELDAGTVELELTETILADGSEHTIEAIEGIKRMGLRLSIDDFGTGFSCLAYLRRFRVDALKIDQSFVQGMLREPNDATITAAIISLAHSLRLAVVAEGVELAEQCAVLRHSGCDVIQGYLFSRPVPAAEVAAMLREGRRLAGPAS